MQSVSCDYCGTDISGPTGLPEFRLALTAQRIPNTEIVKTIAIFPPIDRPHHFCGLTCLSLWASYRSNRRHPQP